jgi:alkylated DNA nucleotide flippase Atl1
MKIATIATAALLAAATPNAAQEAGGGWTVLFDGKSTAAWRSYMKDGFPEAGWTVEPDGSLRVRAGSKAGDLITRKQFGDFELSFDFKIAEGANSGILYRFPEIPGKPAYHNAFEYQLIDDARHKDAALATHRVASLYDLYATDGAVARPIGQWNEARIVARGSVLEHWLNGKRVVQADLKSADYKERLAKSKFATWEGFGVHAKGHIALQEHGDDVWFRNIKIREIR